MAQPHIPSTVVASIVFKESVMSDTVGDFIIERLHAWGVRRIYGYPGDGINGVFGALNRAQSESRKHRKSKDEGKEAPAPIEFIQVRHEEMAAFMATAHAKFTGELGVCIATSGPGASHLITGLYDARMDHMPVLAIAGQQARAALGGHYQQELDLVSMFKDVAGAFVEQASVPAQVRHLVDRAVRIALSERKVTAIVLPNDLQDLPYEAPGRKHGTLHSGVGYRAPRLMPYPDDLQQAADVLNAGKKIAILVGAGALHATDEVIAVAEKLGAGVAKALLGKAALPDDLPWVTGSIGLLGTKPSYDLMTECDTLLMIGSGFPYAEFLPKEGAARGVQIDIKADMLSLRYPMEVNLVGDSVETLRALLPLLEEKPDRAWRKKIEGWTADWWKTLEKRAHEPGKDAVNPQRTVWELSKRIPANSIVTSDSGSCANWYARDLKVQRGMMCSLSGGLASMGAAVPYAIAAKFAYPERPVIALIGDGAMQMNNMAELITVSKYWKNWADPRWICMVLNNGDLNQVTWEQRAMEGDPRYEASQQLPDFPYARYAELIGLRGIRVDDPEQLAGAWEQAFAADRPVVLEAITDPEVPPLPPHITLEQATAMASALAHGDPSRREIITQAAKGKLEEFLPGR
jgi:pyruvate dehydrogenase (quinone)